MTARQSDRAREQTHQRIEVEAERRHRKTGKGVNIATFRSATLVSIGDGRYWAAMGEPESDDPQYLQGPDGKLFVLDLKRMMPTLRQRRPDYFRGG